jgi:GDP-L-fucose synthase
MARSELPFRIEGRRVWVAGHRGMVGSALVRRLAREDCELLTIDRARLDLRRQTEVEAWMHEAKPDVVILAAARVGGISANASRPADFLNDNLALQTNIIHCAAEIGVRKLMFLDRRASIRASRRSQLANRRCLLDLWSQPISGTPSPRSQG